MPKKKKKKKKKTQIFDFRLILLDRIKFCISELSFCNLVHTFCKCHTENLYFFSFLMKTVIWKYMYSLLSLL